MCFRCYCCCWHRFIPSRSIRLSPAEKILYLIPALQNIVVSTKKHAKSRMTASKYYYVMSNQWVKDGRVITFPTTRQGSCRLQLVVADFRVGRLLDKEILVECMKQHLLFVSNVQVWVCSCRWQFCTFAWLACSLVYVLLHLESNEAFRAGLVQLMLWRAWGLYNDSICELCWIII